MREVICSIYGGMRTNTVNRETTLDEDVLAAEKVLERCLPVYLASDLFHDFPRSDEWHLNEFAKRGPGYLKAYCSNGEMRDSLMEVIGRLQYRLENPSEAYWEAYMEGAENYRVDNSGPISEKATFPTDFGAESTSTLIVIGNGFDLDHGMATGFPDFRNFLKECGGRIWEGLESISEYTEVPPEKMWFEFEKYMEGLNTDYLNDYNEDKTGELVSYGSDEFRDRDNHTLEFYYDMDLSWIASVKAAFYEWISTVELPLSKKYRIDSKDSLVLNFNYTDLLEKVYGVPLNKIVHIHGTRLTKDSLIMGHRLHPNSRELNASLGGDDARLRRAYEQCSDYLSEFYKPVELIAERLDDFLSHYTGIERVIVLGHSYNEIDWPYFRVIADRCHDAEFVFSIYSEEDRNRLAQMAEKLSVGKYHIIQSYYEVFDAAE